MEKKEKESGRGKKQGKEKVKGKIRERGQEGEGQTLRKNSCYGLAYF